MQFSLLFVSNMSVCNDVCSNFGIFWKNAGKKFSEKVEWMDFLGKCCCMEFKYFDVNIVWAFFVQDRGNKKVTIFYC